MGGVRMPSQLCISAPWKEGEGGWERGGEREGGKGVGERGTGEGEGMMNKGKERGSGKQRVREKRKIM